MKKKIRIGSVLVFFMLTFALSVGANAEETARIGVITADNVNIRLEPSSESEIIGSYNRNTDITIIGSKGNFFKIQYDGSSGFVSDSFAIVFNYEKGKINASDVILRSKPSTDSEKLDVLDKGEAVLVFGQEDGFYKVTYGTQPGYISSDYVKVSSSSSEVTKTSSKKSSSSGSSSRTVKVGKYTEEELSIVSKLVYLEAKGQGTKAYQAVASVVMNRMQSKKFPSSIEGVVYQSNQFSVVNPREKFLATKPDKKSQEAVKTVFVQGEVSLPNDIMYFKSVNSSADWSGIRDYHDTIGSNMFYS